MAHLHSIPSSLLYIHLWIIDLTILHYVKSITSICSESDCIVSVYESMNDAYTQNYRNPD